MDSAAALSPLALDHFEFPRNVGAVAGANVVQGSAGNRELGANVCFSLRVAQARVAEIRFRAYGCPHTIAAASWLTQRLHGAAVEDLERCSWREIEDALSVPPQKRGKLLILEDAMRAAARAWRQK